MANIIGTNGNDTLEGSELADTINGKAGNDIITGNQDNDTLTGGGGKDKFVYYNSGYSFERTDIITDFGGVGKGVNPTPAVIGEVDTLKFQGDRFTARNLLLTQNGSNLEISFEGLGRTIVILQNFKLEDLENLKASGARPAIGNILFDGQTSITDSFNVLNANSTDTSIGIKNTVTFLNDLDNNITGLDDSDDVVNGQGGDDKIDGKSGNDLLRGGTGNDTLIGGIGNDTLDAGALGGNSLLFGGEDNDYLYSYHIPIDDDEYNFLPSSGNNTLNGGAGNDTLDARASEGNNLLSGGDGNDYLDISYLVIGAGYDFLGSSGNNTLNGGAGNDTLRAESPKGNNLLSGDDGNDYLSTSGLDYYRSDFSFSSSGKNTLNGGVGDDTLRAEYSTGNNLLSGGDGNDYLSTSGYLIQYAFFDVYDLSSGNNTLNGGAGDDTLRAEYSTGNNLLSGGDGNDSFYLSPTSSNTAPSYLVTQTVDGGKGNDLLFVDYSNASAGITTTFNATTNIGAITAGMYRVSYKNTEGLNILGTAYNDNIVGSNSNDTLPTGISGKDTIDGGKGDDVLSVDYSNASAGITTTFNATTNIGVIRAGTSQVSYKNIERLNISGTVYDDNIVGNSGNDTLSTGFSFSTNVSGKDTIDGGKGDDVLKVDYSNASAGITTTFNATTNIGAIRAGTSQVSYKNIERLNISGTGYDDNIVGNSGNDTLYGGYGGNNTIIGGAGNDILTGGYDKDTLTGGAGNDILTGWNGDDTLTGGIGNDKFLYNVGVGIDIITDFGGVGRASNPSAAVIASLDILQFTDSVFTAQNLQLTQNGNNLEITFEGYSNTKVILQNFKLENLDNLLATSSRAAIGNILFDGQTSITDSFDVLDANSTQTRLFKRNTVTFLNDLSNNITGFDNSNDVINGQGGNDIIDGLSGNDLLRGGAGNDILIGSAGNDTLDGGAGNNTLNGGTGDDRLSANGSTGNNTLNGSAGDDSLSASGSTGNNLLFGGDGNDELDISGGYYSDDYSSFDSRSLGNNTLEGGAGNDSLSAGGSKGDNLLFGGDGNDSLDISGYYSDDYYSSSDYRSLGNNTLEGGAGNDSLSAGGSTGNNLLSGGDGNDSFATRFSSTAPSSLVTQTVDGGIGDDFLSVDYGDATGGITSTINATTNIGSITGGNNRVSYKFIEGLNIIGTTYNDNIVGSNGNDTIWGGNGGNDTIIGGAGNDILNGGYLGNNTLYGGNGNDILSGGGNNTLYGGAGTDTFAFYNYYSEGIARVDDFNATNELIQVSIFGFGGGLSSSSLQTNQFTIGASATTNTQRFIYNSATGGLFFDQDGSASGFTQVKFAQLSTGLSLTENNFVVV